MLVLNPSGCRKIPSMFRHWRDSMDFKRRHKKPRKINKMNRTYQADNKINNRKTKEQKTKLNFKQQLPHQKKKE